MITQAQLSELKEARDMAAISALVEKWSAEIFMKESAKDGAVTFVLETVRRDAKKDVVGVKIGKGFAFHKDAWGGSFWVLTHIGSGIKTLSGKKQTMTKVLKDFAKWPGLDVLDKAMTENKMEALKYVPPEITAEYRAFYDKAGY